MKRKRIVRGTDGRLQEIYIDCGAGSPVVRGTWRYGIGGGRARRTYIPRANEGRDGNSSGR